MGLNFSFVVLWLDCIRAPRYKSPIVSFQIILTDTGLAVSKDVFCDGSTRLLAVVSPYVNNKGTIKIL